MLIQQPQFDQSTWQQVDGSGRAQYDDIDLILFILLKHHFGYQDTHSNTEYTLVGIIPPT